MNPASASACPSRGCGPEVVPSALLRVPAHHAHQRRVGKVALPDLGVEPGPDGVVVQRAGQCRVQRVVGSGAQPVETPRVDPGVRHRFVGPFEDSRVQLVPAVEFPAVCVEGQPGDFREDQRPAAAQAPLCFSLEVAAQEDGSGRAQFLQHRAASAQVDRLDVPPVHRRGEASSLDGERRRGMPVKVTQRGNLDHSRQRGQGGCAVHGTNLVSFFVPDGDSRPN